MLNPTKIVLFCAIFGYLNAVAIEAVSPILPRIIGGHDADYNAFPYVVSLQENDKYFCSGIIIDKYTILTTGNCLYRNINLKEIKVLVGSNVLCGGAAYTVSYGVHHYNYNSKYFTNNLGILKLNNPIKFSANVKPAIISTNDAKPGQPVTVVGWGLNNKPEENNNVLQQLPTSILKSSVCRSKYDSYAVNEQQNWCTLSLPGYGTCNNDYGGPLINKDNEVLGIVSLVYSRKVCADGSPDVYVRLSAYKEWISDYSETV